jgi:hypothetical protein
MIEGLLYTLPMLAVPLLFDGNPRRCVFDPSARGGKEQKLKAGATVK